MNKIIKKNIRVFVVFFCSIFILNLSATRVYANVNSRFLFWNDEIGITCNSYNINKFVGEEFSIYIKITPGSSLFLKPQQIKNAVISLSNENFKLVGVNDKKSMIKYIDGNKIILNDIDYNREWFIFFNSEPIELELKIKANKSGITYLENYINLSYNNKIVKLSGKCEIKVIVNDIKYIIPEVRGGSTPNSECDYGEEIDLNYKFVPPASINKSDIINVKSIDNGLDKKNIYIIDEGIFNSAIERNSSIKEQIIDNIGTLEKNSEVALITYGETAKLVKINDKSFYSLDELTNNLRKIDSQNRQGNLGDALMQAQYLINENLNSSINVILVSYGNPAYYSKDNIDKKKENFSLNSKNIGTSFEMADEYVNRIVSIINEENSERDINWLNIDYSSMGNNEVISNTMNSLNGTVLEGNSENFNYINTLCNAEYILSGNLIINSKRKEIELVNNTDKSIKIQIPYCSNSGSNQYTPKVIEEDLKIPIKFLSNEELDVADTNNLEVIFKSDSKQVKDTTFNVDGNVKWLISPKISFLESSGLHNGKLNNLFIPNNATSALEFLSSEIFDGKDQYNYDLARDNSFGLGVLLETNRELQLDINISDNNSDNNIEDGWGWKAYYYDSNSGSFKKLSEKGSKGIKILEKNKIYLIVGDFTIIEDAEIDSTIKINFNLRSNNDPEVIVGTIEKQITVKDKPIHY